MFFFFQAEDGIRDGTVTGVQTCALPISFSIASSLVQEGRITKEEAMLKAGNPAALEMNFKGIFLSRSEERRVGKECRSQRWPHHFNKKKETNGHRRKNSESCVKLQKLAS